jgi:glycosyltransferase involved in cell wall biosynthesis
MPFALDRSTRYISPTKVLEYMAAERPIVSTPIHDVVELYHDIVHLGWGEDGFIQACERALAAPEIEREARQDRARSVLLHTSWDRTAREMHDILCALESRVTTAPDHRAVGA